MLLGVAHPKDVITEDSARCIELLVLHLKEARSAHGLIVSFNRLHFLTEDWKSHFLTNEVGVGPQFNQIGVGETVT